MQPYGQFFCFSIFCIPNFADQIHQDPVPLLYPLSFLKFKVFKVFICVYRWIDLWNWPLVLRVLLAGWKYQYACWSRLAEMLYFSVLDVIYGMISCSDFGPRKGYYLSRFKDLIMGWLKQKWVHGWRRYVCFLNRTSFLFCLHNGIYGPFAWFDLPLSVAIYLLWRTLFYWTLLKWFHCANPQSNRTANTELSHN